MPQRAGPEAVLVEVAVFPFIGLDPPFPFCLVPPRFYRVRLHCFLRLVVGYYQVVIVLFVQTDVISRHCSLYGGEHEVDIVSVALAILLVFNAVVNTFGVYFPDLADYYFPCLLQSFLKETIIRRLNHRYARVGHQIQHRLFPVLRPVACLRDVHRVSLDPVAVLVTVMAVWIVGRLDGFGAHLLLFERDDGFILTDSVLLFEERFKGSVPTIVMLFEEDQVAAEKVIGRGHRLGVLEGHEFQRASSQKVVPVFKEQLPVTPSLTLLEDHHPDQNAYGSIGGAIPFGIEHAEVGLVHAHHDVVSEQVMPGEPSFR